MIGSFEAFVERVESTGLGRWLISAFLLVTLFCITMVNLPDSELRRRTARLSNQYINLTGADQNWGVFAPDARRQVFDMYAIVTYADGSTARWRPPTFDRFINNYRLTRWRKWQEVVVINDYVPAAAPPAAEWIARRNERPGKEPVRVTFVRRIKDLYPPGVEPSESSWHVQTYYVADLQNGKVVR